MGLSKTQRGEKLSRRHCKQLIVLLGRLQVDLSAVDVGVGDVGNEIFGNHGMVGLRLELSRFRIETLAMYARITLRGRVWDLESSIL